VRGAQLPAKMNNLSYKEGGAKYGEDEAEWGGHC